MLRSDKCCEILADTIVEMIAVNKNPFSIPDIDDNIDGTRDVSNTTRRYDITSRIQDTVRIKFQTKSSVQDTKD